MLTLKKLSIKAVGRLVEEQIIDFTTLGSLVQVDGVNRNTGGSSGAAKSTIFNSLDYLLGINDIPSSILQSRLTKEGMLVVGYFDLDGKDLTIMRGKGKLSIDLDGDITTGSNKLTEEKLDQILGMSRDLFRPMLHKRQREGGFFLQMTPQKTHEFLIDCLGLSDMRSKVAKIDAKIAALNTGATETFNAIVSAEASLKATENAIEALGPAPAHGIDRASVEKLSVKYETSLKALNELLEKHKIEESLLESAKPDLPNKPDFDNSLKMKYEWELGCAKGGEKLALLTEKALQEMGSDSTKNLREKIQILTRVVEDSVRSKEEAAKLVIELESISGCICPTCQQNWSKDASLEKKNEIIEKLKILKFSINNGENAKIEINNLNKEIEHITINNSLAYEEKEKALIEKTLMLEKKLKEEQEKEQNALKPYWDEVGKIWNALREKLTKIRQTNAIEQAQARGQADLDRRAFEGAANNLRAYEESKSRYDKVSFSLVEQKTNTEKYISDLVTKRKELLALLAFSEESKRALKSFTSCAFDDALSEISDMATSTIRNIPNMANSTIQLEGIRETKDGKLKEEVNAVISSDGEVGIPIKSLSGGERSAVDLAIDLAIINMLEQRTGKGANIFILDEPFTGLDSISIEMTLEMLKNSNTNKKLILVDHNPEVKQMIDDKITVIRDGLTSKIEQ